MWLIYISPSLDCYNAVGVVDPFQKAIANYWTKLQRMFRTTNKSRCWLLRREGGYKTNLETNYSQASLCMRHLLMMSFSGHTNYPRSVRKEVDNLQCFCKNFPFTWMWTQHLSNHKLTPLDHRCPFNTLPKQYQSPVLSGITRNAAIVGTFFVGK